MALKNAAYIGKIVRETRKAQGLTQTLLATASGVGVRFIVDLEKGKEIAALGKTLRIIQILGIDITLTGPENRKK